MDAYKLCELRFRAEAIRARKTEEDKHKRTEARKNDA
jgi:hypothetical protein